uniref:Uncharacterized protein n=1 Tax=Solanum tuberosum TaxID=4113 RepID=M1CJ13_SOLTU
MDRREIEIFGGFRPSSSIPHRCPLFSINFSDKNRPLHRLHLYFGNVLFKTISNSWSKLVQQIKI